MRTWALVIGSMGLVGCSDDPRPPTAPPLPVPMLDAPCSELDVGADGTVEAVYAFRYDDDGFLTTFVGSSGDVGVYAYDDDHFLLRYAEEHDADVVPEYEEVYTRDRHGRVLTYAQYDAGALMASGEYAYDRDGRLTTGTTMTATGTQTITYQYDGASLNPASARLVSDGGPTVFTFTSTPDELMLHGEIDDGEDGTVDRMTDVVYDEQRRLVSSISRFAWRVYERDLRVYNADGNLTSRIYADDGEGLDDWAFYATFDERGLQTERGVLSPSGAFAGAVYREVDKSECARSRVATPVPQPLRFRRAVVELPLTFAPR